jgi:serine/threonine-protein kinase
LETIVGKALEKDRERRYQSAAEFAVDMRRYLGNEPILARPASAAYQLRKFAARHKVPVSLLAAFVVSVTAFAVFMSIQYSYARAAERRADEEAARAKNDAAHARAMKEFLSGVFWAARPETKGELPRTPEELLELGARRILDGGALADMPRAQAELLEHMGLALLHRGRLESATDLLEAAFAARRRYAAPEDPAFAASLANLGHVYQEMNRFAEAENYYRRAHRIFEEKHGRVDYFTATVLSNLASLVQQRDPAEAEPMFREALAVYREMYAGNHIHLARGIHNLARVLLKLGRQDEAEERFREALAMRLELHGDDHVNIAKTLNGLGETFIELRRYDEAEAKLMRANVILRGEFGANDRGIARNLRSLGRLHHARGDFGRAETVFSEALAMSREFGRSVHMDIAASLNGLGSLYAEELERPGDAIPLLEESLAIRRELLTDKHPALADGLHRLARARERLGLYVEALELFQEEAAIRKAIIWDKQVGYAKALSAVGRTLMQLDRPEEAEPNLRQALAILEFLPTTDESLAESQRCLGTCLVRLGRQDEGESLLREALAMSRRMEADH